jgi:hypothetical protein
MGGIGVREFISYYNCACFRFKRYAGGNSRLHKSKDLSILMLPSLCVLAPCRWPLLTLDYSRALLYRVGSPKPITHRGYAHEQSICETVRSKYQVQLFMLRSSRPSRLHHSSIFAGVIAVLLRALGFNSLSNGVMRILTDQLNSYIEKIA